MKKTTVPINKCSIPNTIKKHKIFGNETREMAQKFEYLLFLQGTRV